MKESKQTVKLNENQLRQVIKEVLKEYPYSPYKPGSQEEREWALRTFTPSTSAWWRAKHPEWSDEQVECAIKDFDDWVKINSDKGARRLA